MSSTIYERAGSESTNADAPLSRTSMNLESIRVCLEGNVAVRIARDGYRLLLQSRTGGFFPWEDAERRTTSLPTKATLVSHLDYFREQGAITPKTHGAVLKALEAWQDRASVAWDALHKRFSGPLPAYAPQGLEALRALLRGV